MRLEVANLGLVDYPRALHLQKALVAARIRDEIGDTLLMLEHPHVFTLGRGADERFVREMRPGVPVLRVSRGGQVTYHGPGQLVGYAILKLEGRRRDVGRYLRDLEQSMIDALALYGIDAQRREHRHARALASTTRRTVLAPCACPALRGMPRRWAHRPLPSIKAVSAAAGVPGASGLQTSSFASTSPRPIIGETAVIRTVSAPSRNSPRLLIE